jgi:hypothetical protein
MNQIHIQEKLGKEDIFPNNSNKVNVYFSSNSLCSLVNTGNIDGNSIYSCKDDNQIIPKDQIRKEDDLNCLNT